MDDIRVLHLLVELIAHLSSVRFSLHGVSTSRMRTLATRFGLRAQFLSYSVFALLLRERQRSVARSTRAVSFLSMLGKVFIDTQKMSRRIQLILMLFLLTLFRLAIRVIIHLPASSCEDHASKFFSLARRLI